MKRNEGKYPIYEKLPKNAVMVKDYAKSLNLLESAIYNRYSRGTAEFKIIIYMERNFILPNNK